MLSAIAPVSNGSFFAALQANDTEALIRQVAQAALFAAALAVAGTVFFDMLPAVAAGVAAVTTIAIAILHQCLSSSVDCLVVHNN